MESILNTFSKEYGQFSYSQKITVQMMSHPCLMKPLSEKSFQSTIGKAEMRTRLKNTMQIFKENSKNSDKKEKNCKL